MHERGIEERGYASSCNSSTATTHVPHRFEAGRGSSQEKID